MRPFLSRIIGVLFPFGPEAIRFDLRTNTFGDSFFTYQAEIKKKSGAVDPDDLFEQEESCGISAVLYSTVEAFNCGEVFGSELILVHNPLATAPLPRGYLRIGRECWREGNQLVIYDHRAPRIAEAS